MGRRRRDVTADLGLLGLRLVAGGLMAGHGAQKLFGVLGGPGLEGTAGFMGSMGLQPKKVWAMLAGGGEFGSGLLIALGLFSPLGQIGLFGPMLMAWNKAHAGKPVWNTEGGAELPIVYMASAAALATTGPGEYSLDALFDIEVPDTLIALTAAGVVIGVVVGMSAGAEDAEAEPDEPAVPESEAGLP